MGDSGFDPISRQSNDVLGTGNISEPKLQVFEVQEVPGKGKGLVARLNITKGTRLICEPPFFTTKNLKSTSMMESEIAEILKSLSETEQKQFLSFHNNLPGEYPLSGIVRTNGLPCGSDSRVGGVFATASLINHSCLPNAHNSWNADTNHETIHAVRDIKSGEEITISYDRGGPSAPRRAGLKAAFGFDCNCSICSLPPPELRRSNDRRIQIQALDDKIGDPFRVMFWPELCLENCYCLFRTLEKEYDGDAGIFNARLYYDAFQISITYSDQARASVFAERAYKCRVVCEGEDSPATQRIKELMIDPAEHDSFGISEMWETAKDQVPKGLDTVGFEKWLWRQKQKT